MIGYDIGACFDADEVSNELYNEGDAQHSKNFQQFLTINTLMDGIPEIGLRSSSNNLDAPYSALDAASHLLAGTTSGVETGGEPEDGALSRDVMPAVIPGDGEPLSIIQQMFNGYGQGRMGASVGDAQTAMFDPSRVGMSADIPFGFGETTRSENGDIIGNAASGWLGMPFQNSNPERGSGLSLVDEASSAVENKQAGNYAADVPGGAYGQLDSDYPYTQLPKAIETGEQSEAVLDAMRNLASWATPEIAYEQLATNIAGSTPNELDQIASTGIVGYRTTQSGNGVSETAGLFHNAPSGRCVPAFEDSSPDSRIRNGVAEENDSVDIEAADAALNRHFAQLTGMGVAGTYRQEAVGEGGVWHKSNPRPPEGAGSNADEVWRSQPNFSTLFPHNKVSGDEGITTLSGMWEMLRNAERFLPKQSNAGGRSEEVAATALSEGPESGLPGLIGKLIARGNMHEHELEALDKRVTGISSDGGRSGPSGHKNDPIYTVAINQVNGTLMPTVATAGTSTRSPAMPGQRNLP